MDKPHLPEPPATLSARYWTAMGLMLAAGAAGAGTADLTDIPFESLTGMQVSTASRFVQSAREAPSAVEVVSREDIRRFGWRTLADILNSLPGLYSTHDGAYDFAGTRGFLIPGDYNTRFLLLVDGQRLNDNIYQQALLGDEFPLDPSLIERVEYVPGPGSSVYGGNAIFGVINVITRRPGEQSPLEISARLSAPEAGTVQISGSRRLPTGASLMAAVGGSIRSGRDTTYRDPVGGLQLGNGQPSPDGVAHDLDRLETRRVMLRYEDGGLTLTGLYGDRRVEPSSALYLGLFDTRLQNVVDANWSLTSHYQSAMSDSLHLEGRLGLSGSAYSSDTPFPDGGGSLYLNHDESRGTWLSGDLRLLYTAYEGHKLIAGFDLQHDRDNRQRNHDVNAAINPPVDISAPTDRRGLYLQDEWTFAADWRLNAGLRLDHLDGSGSQSSPRLGLIWLADSDTTVKLLAGKAYRPANAYERDYGNGINYLGNPLLQPETIRTLEAIYERDLASRSRLTVSLFRYRLDNLITQEALPGGSLQYRNQNPVRTAGAEVSWQTRLDCGLRLNASLAQSRIDDAGALASFSPSWVFKLRGSHPLADGRWQAAVESRLLADSDYLWQGTRYHLPTQVQVNLTLSPAQATPGLSWSLGVRNLLNRRNEQPASEEIPVPSVPGERRSVEIGVRYAL